MLGCCHQLTPPAIIIRHAPTYEAFARAAPFAHSPVFILRMNIYCRELYTFQGPSMPSCPTWIPGNSLSVSSPQLVVKNKATQRLSYSSTAVWTWYEVEEWV